MKDFRSARDAGGGKANATDEETARAVEKAKAMLSSLDGKNEDAVLREIVRRAEEGKRNGTLDNAQIDEFYARFAPLLNEEQKKKIAKVIQRLKAL